MIAILTIAVVIGAWYAARTAIDTLPSIPSANEDFVFL